MKEVATPLDRYVGERVRRFRVKQRMSQGDLGAAIGVSYQQVQKYESGANRISIATGWKIAEALKIDFADLTDGFGQAANRAA